MTGSRVRPRFLVGLFLALLAVALQGVQGEEELGVSQVPSEVQCRPYIEKALKDLGTGSLEENSAEVGEAPDDDDVPTLNEQKDEPTEIDNDDNDDDDDDDDGEKDAADQSAEGNPEDENSGENEGGDSDGKDSGESEGDGIAADEPADDDADGASVEDNDGDNENVETVEVTSAENDADNQNNDADDTDDDDDQQKDENLTEEADDDDATEETAEEQEGGEDDGKDSNEESEDNDAEDGSTEEKEDDVVVAVSKEEDSVENKTDEGSVEDDTADNDSAENKSGDNKSAEEDSKEEENHSNSAADEDDDVEAVETKDENSEEDKEGASIESGEKQDDDSKQDNDEGDNDNDDDDNTDDVEGVQEDSVDSKEDTQEDSQADSKENSNEVEDETKERTEDAGEDGGASASAESPNGDDKSDENEEVVKSRNRREVEGEVEQEDEKENEDDKTSQEGDDDDQGKADSVETEDEKPESEGSDEDEEAEPTPEEDLIQEIEVPENLRPRDHINQLLKLDEENEVKEQAIQKAAEIVLRDLKRLYDTAIKPLETLYKYRDLSNRHFGDPEIFSKPLVLFMGPWSGGKSSIVNYLLDNEYKPTALRTGAEPSPAYFNILMYGEEEEILDGTQLAADWTFSGLQKFGQGMLDRLRGVRLKNKLLEKVNIVEIPGILEIRKQVQRLFPFNDACQWFIDRADIIFLVYDPAKLDVGPETEAILDQLKGREYQTRIILNKADQVKPEELMRVQGALIWNISPLMSSAEPPVMYSTSLWSLPYEAGAPTRLLYAQERAFLRDLRSAIDKRVEHKIASARRFAVRVRNHAKMVDCYLTTYYNHKSFFGNKKDISDKIIENPQDYHIYEGLSTLTNISRYDLPDPDVYKDFFRLNALYDFQQLSATCTYFRGCPINRLDIAIAYDLPELVGKYKKSVEAALHEGETSPPPS